MKNRREKLTKMTFASLHILEIKNTLWHVLKARDVSGGRNKM